MRLERLTSDSTLKRSNERDSAVERQAMTRLRKKVLGPESKQGDTLALSHLGEAAFADAIRKTVASNALAIVSPDVQPGSDSFIMAEGGLAGVEIRFIHLADLPGTQVVSGLALHTRGRVQEGNYVHMNAEALSLHWRLQPEEQTPWFKGFIAQLKHPFSVRSLDRFWARIIAN